MSAEKTWRQIAVERGEAIAKEPASSLTKQEYFACEFMKALVSNPSVTTVELKEDEIPRDMRIAKRARDQSYWLCLMLADWEPL